MRGLAWAAGVVAVAYLAIIAGLYLYQRRLLYHPDRTRPLLGPLTMLGVREVTLFSADGLPLLAWYLPAHGERPGLPQVVQVRAQAPGGERRRASRGRLQ